MSSENEKLIPEANASALFPFERYSFERDQFGVMSLRLYHLNSYVEVNAPHSSLAAVIDLVLRNADQFRFGRYSVGELVGIEIHGLLPNAKAIDGSPITGFRFRRISTGEHELWLSYGNGQLHGGSAVAWEFVLQILQAACAPASAKIKVRTHEGKRQARCKTYYSLAQ